LPDGLGVADIKPLRHRRRQPTLDLDTLLAEGCGDRAQPVMVESDRYQSSRDVHGRTPWFWPVVQRPTRRSTPVCAARTDDVSGGGPISGVVVEELAAGEDPPRFRSAKPRSKPLERSSPRPSGSAASGASTVPASARSGVTGSSNGNASAASSAASVAAVSASVTSRR